MFIILIKNALPYTFPSVETSPKENVWFLEYNAILIYKIGINFFEWWKITDKESINLREISLNNIYKATLWVLTNLNLIKKAHKDVQGEGVGKGVFIQLNL